jgi:hypothetical protein
MPRRTLSLKREVLAELTAADLAIVAGAAPPNPTTIVNVRDTLYSCYAYISCNVIGCVLDKTDVIVAPTASVCA